MPIKVTCSKCGGVLHAPDDAGGKRGRCPTCGNVLAIPLAEGGRMGSAGFGGSPGFPAAPAGPAPGHGQSQGHGMGPKRQMLDDDEPPPVTAPLPRNTGKIASPGRRSSMGPLGGGAPAGYGFADEPKPAGPPGRPVPAGPRPPAASAFARPQPTGDEEPIEDQGRGWKKVRGGLGIVRLGVVLLVLAPIAAAGLAASEKSSPLPNKNPGFLGVQDLTSVQEIRVGVVLVPVALGLLLVLVGRMRVARAPKSSFARGLARASSSATLLAIAAVLAAGIPAAIGLKEGIAPADFQQKDNVYGIVERFGLSTAVSALVVAEVWFVFALGRMGAALGSPVLAGRATRFALLAGLLVVLGAAAGVGYFTYWPEIQMWWNANARAEWDKIDPGLKPAARAGVVAAAAVVAGFCYLRLIGGGRRAIREWQERNPVAV